MSEIDFPEDGTDEFEEEEINTDLASIRRKIEQYEEENEKLIVQTNNPNKKSEDNKNITKNTKNTNTNASTNTNTTNNKNDSKTELNNKNGIENNKNNVENNKNNNNNNNDDDDDNNNEHNTNTNNNDNNNTKLFNNTEAQPTQQGQDEEEVEYVEKIEEGQGNTEDDDKKENQEEIDKRSIFVNNVDYNTDAEELRDFFKGCGTIERITIVCDKFTGKPKGCAYIQFKSEESVAIAIDLNDKEFRGRQIKVEQKRTNVPAWLMSKMRGGSSPVAARRRRRRAPLPYYGPPQMYPSHYSYYPTRPPRSYRVRRGLWGLY